MSVARTIRKAIGDIISIWSDRAQTPVAPLEHRDVLVAVSTRTVRCPLMLSLWLNVLASGILLGLVYGLVALGLTIIFGVMRVVNFAHGEMVVFRRLYRILGGSPLGRPDHCSGGNRCGRHVRFRIPPGSLDG